MSWSRHSPIRRDMAADARAEIGDATLYHTQGIDSVHRIVCRSANAAGGGAQEGASSEPRRLSHGCGGRIGVCLQGETRKFARFSCTAPTQQKTSCLSSTISMTYDNTISRKGRGDYPRASPPSPCGRGLGGGVARCPSRAPVTPTRTATPATASASSAS